MNRSKQKAQSAKLLQTLTEALPDAKPESRKAEKPVTQQASKPNLGEVVTVGAKVYKELAYFWTAQGKLTRKPVSDVIREALVAAYGLPEGFDSENVKPEVSKTVKP